MLSDTRLSHECTSRSPTSSWSATRRVDRQLLPGTRRPRKNGSIPTAKQCYLRKYGFYERYSHSRQFRGLTPERLGLFAMGEKPEAANGLKRFTS